MMVFLEMPSAYEFKDATIENVSKEWMEAIKQNYNHPSISKIFAASCTRLSISLLGTLAILKPKAIFS